MNSRKYWIDGLRGFAIILIVLGHFFQGFKFTLYIYIFHVPLFFVISGMCFNSSDSDIRAFFTKKIKSLIVPYFSFGIVVVPMAYLLEEDYTFHGFINVIFSYIIQRRFTTMWFLTTLFVTEIIFKLIHQQAKNKNEMFRVILILSSLFMVYEYIFNIDLPWNLDLSMICLLFYEIGYLIKELKLIDKIKNKLNLGFLIGILLSSLGILLGTISIRITSRRLDIFYGELGMPIIGILGAFFTCVGLVYISFCIPRIKILESIGCHTMSIFALHQMVFKQLFMKILHFETKGGTMILMASCITIILCYCIDICITKSPLKWIIGKH